MLYALKVKWAYDLEYISECPDPMTFSEEALLVLKFRDLVCRQDKVWNAVLYFKLFRIFLCGLNLLLLISPSFNSWFIVCPGRTPNVSLLFHIYLSLLSQMSLERSCTYFCANEQPTPFEKETFAFEYFSRKIILLLFVIRWPWQRDETWADSSTLPPFTRRRWQTAPKSVIQSSTESSQM